MSVTAAAASLQTESSEHSSMVSTIQVAEAPDLGRNYLGLLNLLPGVVNTAANDAPSVGSDIRINGSRYESITLNLDGIPNLDVGGANATQTTPPMDALAELKVLSNSYQAEYGRSYGGVINVVTKSGSRDLHGGAYDYFRNTDLNANDFFNNRNGLPRGLYKYNFTGYFIGGPVWIPKILKSRDKLFFFWSQEFDPRTTPEGAVLPGATLSTTGAVRMTMPTALERAGNFSQTFDTNGNMIVIQDPQNNKAPFPGNIIPANRIDPVGQALLKAMPMPNVPNTTNTFNYVFQGALVYPNRIQVLRVDYNISSKDTFYTQAHLSKDMINSTGNQFYNTFPVTNTYPALGANYNRPAKGFTSTWIHTFTSHMINETTFGINRFTQSMTVSPEQSAHDNRAILGVAFPQFYPVNNPYDLLPATVFGGVQNPPNQTYDSRIPYVGTTNIKVFTDNLSLIVGKHNFKAGVYVERTARNGTSVSSVGQTFPGTVDFSRNVLNPLDTNYAFSNAMLGSINLYQESNKRWIDHDQLGSIEPFVQDNWKVTKRLTLDIGIRFDHIMIAKLPGQQLAVFNPSVYSSALAPQLIQPYLSIPGNLSSTREGINPATGQIVPAVQIGSLAPGTGQFFQGMELRNGTVMRDPLIIPAPRFGFAWDVFGNGKTALRGGWGIFPGYISGDSSGSYLTDPPNQEILNINYTTISALTSYAASAGTSALYVTPGNATGVALNVKSPRTYNSSLGVQQSIGFATIVDVSYVGSVSRHLEQFTPINAIPYGADFLPQNIDPTVAGGTTPLSPYFLRPYRGFGQIDMTKLEGNASYNSLQAQANRRLRRDLTFGISWTWSKTMDLTDAKNTAVNPFINPRERDYGEAGFDQTHLFVANFDYRFPKVSDLWNNAFTRTVFDNWGLYGVSSFLSGMPLGITYSLVSGASITGTPDVGVAASGVDARVDLIGNPVLPRSQRTDIRAFNTSAIAQPSFASFGIGDAGKDVFRGPGVNNWDAALHKNFPLGKKEQRRIEFRWEAYNVFNHSQFSTVDTGARFDANGNQTNATFGQYLTARGPRRLQFGLKFYF